MKRFNFNFFGTKISRRVTALAISTVLIAGNITFPSAEPTITLSLTKSLSDCVPEEIEYGSTDVKFTFDDTVLSGVTEGDDVHLVADASYGKTTVDPDKTSIVLTNFTLKGEDAEKYKFTPTTEHLIKYIKIVPKTIYIKPDIPLTVYYGQYVPLQTTEIAPYDEYIEGSDTVNITALFGIDFVAAAGCGTAEIHLLDVTCDNPNYKVEMAHEEGNDRLFVHVEEYFAYEYEPLSKPNRLKDTDDDGSYVSFEGSETKTFEAPPGFLIADKNLYDADWKDTLTVKLKEGEENSFRYFLRNTDDSATFTDSRTGKTGNFKDAITSERTFYYNYYKTKAQIEDCVFKPDPDTPMATVNQYTYGIFSKNKILVDVKAKGSKISQDTNIYFGSTGTESDDSVLADQTLGSDEYYRYDAEYVIPENHVENPKLQIFAKNKAGNGEALVFDNVITENTPPTVEEVGDGFYNEKRKICIQLDVKDAGSGIRKIEYGWDLDAENSQNGVDVGFKGNNYTDEYVTCKEYSSLEKEERIKFELPFDDSIWVKNDKHQLFLKITDNCGNVYGGKISDTIGSDEKAPLLSDVKLELADPAEAAVLNRISYGIFGNGSVKISAKAEDYTEPGLFTSGIKEVKFCDKVMTLGEDGTYSVIVPLNYMTTNAFVSAEDKAGNSKILKITDVFGDVESNTVVLEKECPGIEIQPNVPFYADKDGKNWFGIEGLGGHIEVSVQENATDCNSGIASIKVFDNDNVIFEKNDFSEITLSHIYDTYTMGTLGKGKHTIRTEVCDNAGNEKNAVKTYYVDLAAPVIAGLDDGRNTYVNTGKKLKISASDEGSGIKTVKAYVNEKEITEFDGIIDFKTISEKYRNTNDDTAYKIKIFATDYANNTTMAWAEFYLDDTAPKVTGFNLVPGTVDGITGDTFGNNEYIYKYFFNSPFTLEVNCSDRIGWVDKAEYRLVTLADGKEKEIKKATEPIKNGKAKIDIPKDFIGTVYVKVIDGVGNESEQLNTKVFVVDADKPQIDIIPANKAAYSDLEGNALYKENNSFKVEISDEKSGIRTISYVRTAENEPMKNTTVNIGTGDFSVGDMLEDGWEVLKIENGVVKKVGRTFVEKGDDNDIMYRFDATDNSMNTAASKSTEKFSVDSTAPVIDVEYGELSGNGIYYKEKRTATITVTDRNINVNNLGIGISNASGDAPKVAFEKLSKDKYVATVVFEDGDYTVDISGSDLCGYKASVNYVGENAKTFSVDTVKPAVTGNFEILKNGYVSGAKNIILTVNEHNFDSALTKVEVLKKAAGTAHDANGFEDVTKSILEKAAWNEAGDKNTLSFEIAEDSVYLIRIDSTDKAGNASDILSSPVFEIDSTNPVIKSRNDKEVRPTSIENVEVIGLVNDKVLIPSVAFFDVNFDHLTYSLEFYDLTQRASLAEIRPEKLYIKEDTEKTGILEGDVFTLSNFDKDGIYELKISAVDKSGNKSETNVNTYVRIVDRDILAYIPGSDESSKTGVYSFEYEDGTPISKRLDDMEDITVKVYAKNDEEVKLVFRDKDGNTYDTKAKDNVEKDVAYGISLHTLELNKEMYREYFQDDADIQLRLSVTTADSRIDLANIHIDNAAPECTPEESFKSWHWYFGSDRKAITVSGINEPLNSDKCKVFDNDKEIPFEYSKEDGTLTFYLDEGWHNVGITLVDFAGNVKNIEEKTNIYVGYFWLYIIIAGAVCVLGVGAFAVIRIRIKKKRQYER